MNAKNFNDENYGKDTHMDLDLDMWITHNRTKVYYTTLKYTYPTTVYPVKQVKQARCLISYYGYTKREAVARFRAEMMRRKYAK